MSHNSGWRRSSGASARAVWLAGPWSRRPPAPARISSARWAAPPGPLRHARRAVGSAAICWSSRGGIQSGAPPRGWNVASRRRTAAAGADSATSPLRRGPIADPERTIAGGSERLVARGPGGELDAVARGDALPQPGAAVLFRVVAEVDLLADLVVREPGGDEPEQPEVVLRQLIRSVPLGEQLRQRRA